MYWSVVNSRYEVGTLKGGTGTARALELHADSNSGQVILNTDGTIDIGEMA